MARNGRRMAVHCPIVSWGAVSTSRNSTSCKCLRSTEREIGGEGGGEGMGEGARPSSMNLTSASGFSSSLVIEIMFLVFFWFLPVWTDSQSASDWRHSGRRDLTHRCAHAGGVQQQTDVGLASNELFHRPERVWDGGIMTAGPLVHAKPVEEELHFPPPLVPAHHAGALPALLLARTHVRSRRDAELQAKCQATK